MKSKITFIFFFAVVFICKAQVAGDTLTVNAYNDLEIRTNPAVGHTSYPNVVNFPTGDFRKIIMSLKFECADGERCGEWDYGNHIYLEKIGNGPVLHYEIARFITPYGFYHNSNSGWNHTWYYDVTDFDGLLEGDNIELMYRHSGYEANNDRGWKVNINFHYIYGDPIRKINHVERIYNGNWKYGVTDNPIEDNAVEVSLTTQPNTTQVRIKSMITGHGSDDTGCGEFCKKNRTIKWDGAGVDTRAIWRDDCGMNAEYPQAGTWVFDRAGWCPGADVRYDNVDITGVTAGNHSINMDFETYTSPGGNAGSYLVTTYAIEYEDPTHANDVEIQDIIAPSTKDTHKRFNPICGESILKIRNNGTTNLTSLTIEYGPENGDKETYDWSGNLAFGESEVVYIPELMNFPADENKMEFELKNPNGVTDEYTADNSSSSTFIPVEVLPYEMTLYFKSNNAAQENDYRVIDMSDNTIIFERTEIDNNTVYEDELALPNGCYKIELTDIGPGVQGLNKDGIDFWFSNQQVNEGRGLFRLLDTDGTFLKDFTKVQNNIRGGDFGTEFTYSFKVENSLGVDKAAIQKHSLILEQNPSEGIFNFRNENYITQEAQVKIYTLEGKVVLQKKITSTPIFSIDLSGNASGIYLFVIENNNKKESFKLIKK